MSQVSRKFQGYLSHSWSQNWGEPCPERRAEDGSFTSAAAAADHGGAWSRVRTEGRDHNNSIPLRKAQETMNRWVLITQITHIWDHLRIFYLRGMGLVKVPLGNQT